jgi:hypothetical protein
MLLSSRSPGHGRKRKLVLAAAMVGCAGLLYVAIRGLQANLSPEPTYEGRTLTQWLRSRDFDTARHRVDFAILSMGTAAAPHLKRHLRSGAKTERDLYKIAPYWFRSRWPTTGTLYETRSRALSAVETLGGLGRSCTPELLSMVGDRSEFPDLRRRAMKVLLLIGADPSTFLSALDRVASDPDWTVRQTAGGYAVRLRKDPVEEKERQLWEKLVKSNIAPTADRLGPGPLWAPDETGVTLNPSRRTSQ